MGRTPDQILALARGEHTDALAALEDANVAATAGPLELELASLLRGAGARWVRAFGSLEAEATPVELAAIAAYLRGGVAALDLEPLGPAVLAMLGPAFALGVAQAAEIAEVREGADRRPRPTPLERAQVDASLTLATAAKGAALLALGGLALARTPTWPHLARSFSKSHTIVSIVQRLVATFTQGSAHRGGTALAATHGLGRLWVPERDACYRCQAFAGRVAKAGAFTAGTYYGDGKAPDPVLAPPLHPNCRCQQVPIEPGSAAAAEMTAALGREARRSVAKGWTEAGGESNAAALRATERLLDAGGRLPKSVLREAELAVGRGGFVQRTVPTGGGS